MKNSNLLANEIDHNRIAENTFSSPVLQGEPAVVTDTVRHFIPKGLGEGTFREVLLGTPVVKAFADTLSVIGAISGINVPDSATKIVNTKAVIASRSLPKILKDPEVSAMGSIVMRTDWYAGDSMERSIWLMHNLAIMQSETHFIHPNVELGKNTPVSLAQVKPETYVREVSLLNMDDEYKSLLNKFIPNMARLYKLPFNLFLNASGFQSVPGSLVVVPALHFMYLKQSLNDRFLWFKGAWTPIRADDRESPVWRSIKDKSYIKSYYLGRQALLTLLHISPQFKILSTFKYPGRFLEDITNFMAFVHSTNLVLPTEAGDIFDELDEVKTYKDEHFWAKGNAKGHRYHPGYDLIAQTGTPIYAIHSGAVKLARWENPQIRSGKGGGYGRYVKIAHPGSMESVYAHLKSFKVAEGATVKEGQLIGYSDSTGHSTGGHLHIELKKNGVKVDPKTYFKTDFDIRKSIKPLTSVKI